MFCVLSVNHAYAKTTQDNINDTKNQIDDLQNQKKDAENEVNNIEDRKENLESDLSGLNGQLSELATSMNELETQISDKEDEIENAEADLEAAEAQSDKQYEDMKVRIQFMYGNSNVSVWQMLLESTSLSDFLNRTEYISDINRYDREMLTTYQELQESIAEQKAGLEADMEELLALKEDMQQKQDSVNSLIGQTKANIAQTNQDLEDAKENVSDLDAKLQKMIEYEKQLELQKAQEDPARLAAIKAQEQEDTSGVVYVPTDSDAYLLGAIIQCESDGEPYEGKLAVGSVVLNRVRSSYFPNTISGVIYQSGQFSPVASGRLAYRLEAGVNGTCLQAAQEVLNGNITLNCLYFRTNNGIISGTVIGNHVFY
jgi:spore germination cell wall hydrolase CwlJ-like protein